MVVHGSNQICRTGCHTYFTGGTLSYSHHGQTYSVGLQAATHTYRILLYITHEPILCRTGCHTYLQDTSYGGYNHGQYSVGQAATHTYRILLYITTANTLSDRLPHIPTDTLILLYIATDNTLSDRLPHIPTGYSYTLIYSH